VDLRESLRHPVTRHPWETARLRFFRRQLLARRLLLPGTTVVDVGAGDAFLARQLADDVTPGGRVFAFDPHYTDARLQQLASEHVPAPLVHTRTRPVAPVDLVLLLDVLEHVADDGALLADVAVNLVKPGGHVLICVPAWDQLYTRHDAILGHYRRYSPAQLRKLIHGSGLALLGGGGLFHVLLPLRALRRVGEGRFVDAAGCRRGENPAAFADTGLSSWRAGGIVTALVDGILRADNGLSAWASRADLWLPGLSLWSLAVRTV
jgi:SAM-dependent methyltransferase